MKRNEKARTQKRIRRDLKTTRDKRRYKKLATRYTYIFAVNEQVCPPSKVAFMQTLCDNMEKVGWRYISFMNRPAYLGEYEGKRLSEYPKLRFEIYVYFWNNKDNFDFDGYFKCEETVKSNYDNTEYSRRSENEFIYNIVPSFNIDWLKVVKIAISKSYTESDLFHTYYDGYYKMFKKYGKNVSTVEHPHPNRDRDMGAELNLKYGRKKYTKEYLKDIYDEEYE